MAFQAVLAAREDYSQVLLLSEHLVISAAVGAAAVIMLEVQQVLAEAEQVGMTQVVLLVPPIQAEAVEVLMTKTMAVTVE